MKILITGTSSGIGKAITQRLLKAGHEIYGISRTSAGITNELFHETLFDLSNENELMKYINSFKKEVIPDVLINNAGCGYYGLHENIATENISEMLKVNLLAPMQITGALLPSFKKSGGNIINISSVTAKSTNPHGAAYGATKAGLSSFFESIFAEARKYNVHVTNIHPEMTDTNLYRNADFSADTTDGCCLYPEDIADIVENILSARSGLNYNDITVNPEYHRIAKKEK